MKQAPMQKKLYFSFFFVFLTFTTQGQLTAFEQELKYADSLFVTQKYTEAFQVYETLVHKHRVFSPQMLLKMAYVKEGIGDFPGALYYLSLYHKYSPQLDVLRRMEKIAKEHNYEGYNYGDRAVFQTLYARYRLPVTLGLLALSLGWLILLAYRQRKQQSIRSAGFGLIFFLVLVAGWYNFPTQEMRGVIQQDTVFLMEAPAAGSKIVTVLDKGHQLPVTDSEDIWYQVKWQGETAYLRRHTMLTIP